MQMFPDSNLPSSSSPSAYSSTMQTGGCNNDHSQERISSSLHPICFWHCSVARLANWVLNFIVMDPRLILTAFTLDPMFCADAKCPHLPDAHSSHPDNHCPSTVYFCLWSIWVSWGWGWCCFNWWQRRLGLRRPKDSSGKQECCLT